MSTAPRTPLSTARIVEVAARVADRDGFEHLALGRVATELGVRTPSLYNHIEGLDQLRRLVTVHAVTQLGAEIQRAAVGRRSGDAVRAIAGAYRGFAHAHPGLYGATVPSSSDADITAAADAVLDTVLAALSGFELDTAAAIHATRSLRSAVHGFVDLELAGGFGLPHEVDTSFRWLTELLVTGIRSSATA